MKELAAKLFDVGELPTRVVLLVAVCSATVLFAPAPVSEHLHTEALVTRYGEYVGVALVASTLLLLCNVVVWVVGRLQADSNTRLRRSQAVAHVRELDPAEQAVLRQFLLQQRSTLDMPVNDPTVAGLLSSGVLQQVSRWGRVKTSGFECPVQLAPHARRVLRPEHVGLPKGAPGKR